MVTEGRDHWAESEITKLRRELEELKYNQPPTLTMTSAQSLGMDGIGYKISTNSSFTANLRFTSLNGENILPLVEYDIYLNGTRSLANRYSTGANWGAATVKNTFIRSYWTAYYPTVPNQIVYRVELWNFTAGDLYVGIEVQGRYIPGNVLLS